MNAEQAYEIGKQAGRKRFDAPLVNGFNPLEQPPQEFLSDSALYTAWSGGVDAGEADARYEALNAD